MVSGKGFYLDADGKYKDVEDDEEVTVLELIHPEHGLVKYVVYDGANRAVNWTPTDELPFLPDDWEDEL